MATIELAISIRQPYVEQILLGVKPYEYRSTLTRIRGRGSTSMQQRSPLMTQQSGAKPAVNPECFRPALSSAAW
jgi:hypothetical protein